MTKGLGPTLGPEKKLTEGEARGRKVSAWLTDQLRRVQYPDCVKSTSLART